VGKGEGSKKLRKGANNWYLQGHRGNYFIILQKKVERSYRGKSRQESPNLDELDPKEGGSLFFRGRRGTNGKKSYGNATTLALEKYIVKKSQKKRNASLRRMTELQRIRFAKKTTLAWPKASRADRSKRKSEGGSQGGLQEGAKKGTKGDRTAKK